MSGLIPYLSFDGNAAEALTAYQSIFGGELHLYTYETLGRSDGPSDATGHGMLLGDVEIAGSDAGEGEVPFVMSGMSFSLLGTADPDTLTQWFTALTDGGTVESALQLRPWGDYDGTVTDRFGVRWLIGYQGSEAM